MTAATGDISPDALSRLRDAGGVSPGLIGTCNAHNGLRTGSARTTSCAGGSPNRLAIGG